MWMLELAPSIGTLSRYESFLHVHENFTILREFPKIPKDFPVIFFTTDALGISNIFLTVGVGKVKRRRTSKQNTVPNRNACRAFASRMVIPRGFLRRFLSLSFLALKCYSPYFASSLPLPPPLSFCNRYLARSLGFLCLSPSLPTYRSTSSNTFRHRAYSAASACRFSSPSLTRPK